MSGPFVRISTAAGGRERAQCQQRGRRAARPGPSLIHVQVRALEECTKRTWAQCQVCHQACFPLELVFTPQEWCTLKG